MKNAVSLVFKGFCRLLEGYRDYDKNIICMPWQHMQIYYGRVCF